MKCDQSFSNILLLVVKKKFYEICLESCHQSSIEKVLKNFGTFAESHLQKFLVFTYNDTFKKDCIGGYCEIIQNDYSTSRLDFSYT